MNGRVCFLARAGDALSAVRLVGLRSDESWKAGTAQSADAADVLAEAQSAAAWIAERATTGVGFLCIDVDGSNCSWLTLPGDDAQVVGAMLERHEDAGADWRAPDSGGASIQALSAPTVKRAPVKRLPGKKATQGEFGGHRLAVLAVPDALARVVIDELDDRGVAVETAASLWHAMALAWDPASPLLAEGVRGDRVVGSDAPATAVVLVDPEGRLVWAWARAGELLAGGVVLTPASGDAAARVGKAAVSRVVADWLGWSVQLGVTPSRIVCVAPRTGEGTDEDLSPAQIGSSLGKSWAGATVDMAVVDDPVGATLQRLAGSEEQPGGIESGRTSLTMLSRRPRRVHRSMYLWGALAMVLLAAGLVGVGVKAWRNAGVARVKRADVQKETRDSVLKAVPPGGDAVAQAIAEGNPRKYLEDKLNERHASKNVNTGLPPARPILSELESLSFVLGNDEIELQEIQLSDSIIHVYVYVPSTKAAEELLESLQNIANDHCTWAMTYPNQKKDKLQLVHLDGTWKSGGGGSGGGKP